MSLPSIKQNYSSGKESKKKDSQSSHAGGGKQVTGFGNPHSGVPITLSEKYKRMHKYTIKKLLDTAVTGMAGNSEEDFVSPKSAPTVNQSSGGTYQTTPAKKSGGGHGYGNGDDDKEEVPVPTIPTVPNIHNSIGKDGLGSDKSNDRDDDQIGADDTGLYDRIFEPFPLKPTSSFAPSTVSPKQLARMDARIRAKYLAYEKPNQALLEKIGMSEKRARKWLLEKHKKMEECKIEERKKWELLHRAIEDPVKKAQGEKLALEAHRRILKKKSDYKLLREREFQYLVEGQSNSIDAIQLKEYLLPSKLDGKPEFIFTPREKARLEELISMNYTF